jgi:hypothetical protein
MNCKFLDFKITITCLNERESCINFEKFQKQINDRWCNLYYKQVIVILKSKNLQFIWSPLIVLLSLPQFFSAYPLTQLLV